MEFGVKNDELKNKINELKVKLKQYRIQSSFETAEDLSDDRSTKRQKLESRKEKSQYVMTIIHYRKVQKMNRNELNLEKMKRGFVTL